MSAILCRLKSTPQGCRVLAEQDFTVIAGGEYSAGASAMEASAA